MITHYIIYMCVPFRCAHHFKVFFLSGVTYRMVGGENYGRVEVALGDTWGTVCDTSWDDNEARVFCRQMNFTDGKAARRGAYGFGTGPVWLSHLRCTGNETHLHRCPHRGWDSELSEVEDDITGILSTFCASHKRDAGVFCFSSGRRFGVFFTIPFFS